MFGSKMSRSFKSVLMSVIVAITTSALAAETERRYPTHYIYKGKEISLELLQGRLAVLRSANIQSDGFAEKVAGALNESATEIDPGNTRWSMLELSSAPSSRDVGERIEILSPLAESDFASPVFSLPNIEWVIVTPVILLRFNPESIRDADALLKSLAPDLEIVETNFGGLTGAYKLRSSSKDGFGVLAQANELSEHDQIAWAEPDFRLSVNLDNELTQRQKAVDLGSTPNFNTIRERNPEGIETNFGFIPNDPDFPDAWHILNTGQNGGMPDADIDGDLAWDITTGDSSIKVLVMDDGIQFDHPDLNAIPGKDFTDDPLGNSGFPANACDNHGTLVAGVISEIMNNNIGSAGIAPDCVVLPARVLISSPAFPPCGAGVVIQTSWVADALSWGLSQGARVSNASFVIGASSLVSDTYAETRDSGMIHFAAAGNYSTALVFYPANLPEVNGVSAVDRTGSLAGFSSYGPELSVSAPGCGNSKNRSHWRRWR